MYHDVYVHDQLESGFTRNRDLAYKMPAERFEEQVKSISDFCQENQLPKEYVLFSFDDGGKSFHKVIAPILEQYGYRGIFFITTSYIGQRTFLNEDEIRDLRKRGHLIGSHAHTHEHMSHMSDRQIEEEWRQSTAIIQKILGEPVSYASVPNGDTSRRVLDMAAKNGISCIYTSEPTVQKNRHGKMDVVGRFVVLGNSTMDSVISIVSSRKRRFVLLCKRRVIILLKKLLGKYYIRIKLSLFG